LKKKDSASIINESGVVLLVEDSKPPANDAVDQMMDFYSGADEPSCPHQLQVENVFFDWAFMFDPASNHRLLLHKIDHCVVDEEEQNVRLIPDSNYVFIRDTWLKQCILIKDYAAVCGNNLILWEMLLQSFQPCSSHCKLGQ
jgi:hypothetical protein